MYISILGLLYYCTRDTYIPLILNTKPLPHLSIIKGQEKNKHHKECAYGMGPRLESWA